MRVPARQPESKTAFNQQQYAHIIASHVWIRALRRRREEKKKKKRGIRRQKRKREKVGGPAHIYHVPISTRHCYLCTLHETERPKIRFHTLNALCPLGCQGSKKRTLCHRQNDSLVVRLSHLASTCCFVVVACTLCGEDL